jgi:hypothetical protein
LWFFLVAVVITAALADQKPSLRVNENDNRRTSAVWWFLARPLGWLVGAGLLALAAILNALDPGIFSQGVRRHWPAASHFQLCRTNVAVRIFAAVTAFALVWMYTGRL